MASPLKFEIVFHIRTGEQTRNENGRLYKKDIRGIVLVCRNENGDLALGWSKLYRGDKWNRKDGMQIARLRAIEFTKSTEVPSSIQKFLRKKKNSDRLKAFYKEDVCENLFHC